MNRHLILHIVAVVVIPTARSLSPRSRSSLGNFAVAATIAVGTAIGSDISRGAVGRAGGSGV